MPDLTDVEWTHDCSGKQDYDAELVRLSTRYWPAGGGFLLFDGKKIHGNEDRPEILPSACSEILLRDETIAKFECEGASEADVKQQVETWAAGRFAVIEAAVRAALAGETA